MFEHWYASLRACNCCHARWPWRRAALRPNHHADDDQIRRRLNPPARRKDAASAPLLALPDWPDQASPLIGAAAKQSSHRDVRTVTPPSMLRPRIARPNRRSHRHTSVRGNARAQRRSPTSSTIARPRSTVCRRLAIHGTSGAAEAAVASPIPVIHPAASRALHSRLRPAARRDVHDRRRTGHRRRPVPALRWALRRGARKSTCICYRATSLRCWAAFRSPPASSPSWSTSATSSCSSRSPRPAPKR